jgi:hypothetical protein
VIGNWSESGNVQLLYVWGVVTVAGDVAIASGSTLQLWNPDNNDGPLYLIWAYSASGTFDIGSWYYFPDSDPWYYGYLV